MKNLSKVLAASVLAFAASASQAAVVESWDFALEMNWDISKTVFSPGAQLPGWYNTTSWYKDGIRRMEWLDRGLNINTRKELSWGSELADASFSHSNPRYARSGLVIQDGAGRITTSFEGQSPIVTSANMFTHHNGAISYVADLLTRAQLDVAIQLKPLGSSTPVDIPTQSYDVYFLETTNWGYTGCSYSSNCDDDILVVVPKIGFTSVFEHEGIEYTLNYFEGTNSIKQFDAATCSLVMGRAYTGGPCFGFTTPEHGRTDIRFNLSITTAVPEPETYAMLLAGLGMIGVVVRRRRTHR